MVRYFYSLMPLGIITSVVLLSLPWLGLIALMVVVLVVLPALAVAILAAPYLLVRTIVRSWHAHVGAAPRPAAVHVSLLGGNR